ncbi:unnamed protein product [Cylicostephanus goldi]|uniref:Uncharacterized protein n=1 Tax=Cylicostephanus goldi TaxID=71465 RepID=A0A3P7R4R3_CYLGO|nr:unnamed protein product [Cylicostephanus goldi]
MHTSENDTSRSNSSVVSRPRQSKWPAISMDDALAFIEKADVPVTVKHVPIAVAKVGESLE